MCQGKLRIYRNIREISQNNDILDLRTRFSEFVRTNNYKPVTLLCVVCVLILFDRKMTNFKNSTLWQPCVKSGFAFEFNCPGY